MKNFTFLKNTAFALMLAVAPLANAQTNLLLNPGFESTPYSTSWSAVTLSNVTGETGTGGTACAVIDGLQSLRLSSLTQGSYIGQTISVTEGKTYDFGFTGRVFLGVNDPTYVANSKVQCEVRTGATFSSGTMLGSILTIAANINVDQAAQFTVPTGVTQVTIRISKPASNGAIAMVDKVFISEAKATATHPSASVEAGSIIYKANALEINCKDKVASLRISNFSGQTMIEITNPGTVVSTNLLANGAYLVKATTTNGKSFQAKFIK